MRAFAPTMDAALAVTRRLRPADAREIFAVRWDDDPAALAADCLAPETVGWILGLERPITILGAAPLHPGVWQVHCMGTAEFPRIAVALTRFVARRMIPALVEAGAHRGECRSHAEHHQAHRWLARLGAACEGRLVAYGRGGEDFLVFAADWRRHPARTPSDR
jgi:hypothetical protein